VAAAVVRLAQRPRRETLIGGGGRQLALLRALTPPLGERVVARMVELDHFQRKPAPPSSGNVLAPIPGLTTSDGGWRAGRRRAFRALALSGGALAPLAVPGVRRRVRAGARRSR
jgi:hypothetical protein